MQKLFLDDIRQPKNAYYLVKDNRDLYTENDWVVVKDYPEFVNWIKRDGLPDFISFDHDLADVHYEIDFSDWEFLSSDQLGVEETGYDCAKWLVEYCLDNGFKLPPYNVHSANPVGRKNIESYLRNAKKHLNL